MFTNYRYTSAIEWIRKISPKFEYSCQLKTKYTMAKKITKRLTIFQKIFAIYFVVAKITMERFYGFKFKCNLLKS